MDLPLSDNIVSVILTTFALVIAGGFFWDMYNHGVIGAAPRDGVVLLLFIAIRVYLGRTVRSTAPAPGPEPEPAGD